MKTAVDQLIEKMSLEDVCKYSNELAEAKEMEKEHIKDAYKADLHPCSDEDAEEYYNTTFKQQEQ
jgi:hypothetical protein